METFQALRDALISLKILATWSKGSRWKPTEVVLGWSIPTACRSLKQIGRLRLPILRRSTKIERGEVRRAISKLKPLINSYVYWLLYSRTYFIFIAFIICEFYSNGNWHVTLTSIELVLAFKNVLIVFNQLLIIVYHTIVEFLGTGS